VGVLFTKTVTSCAKTPFHDVAFCEYLAGDFALRLKVLIKNFN
jgi:hypothetical protein